MKTKNFITPEQNPETFFTSNLESSVLCQNQMFAIRGGNEDASDEDEDEEEEEDTSDQDNGRTSDIQEDAFV
ncbi:MAG: hypothetical protein R6U04_09740 [Bacteroidales bacterium]